MSVGSIQRRTIMPGGRLWAIFFGKGRNANFVILKSRLTNLFQYDKIGSKLKSTRKVPHMDDPLKSALTNYELFVLSSIVQVGDATYKELVGTQSSLFNHAYFADTRGRIRTKLVQMQCEIESHDPKFPFSFWQRNFPYEQCIPELQTKNTIIHIARSTSPDKLPYPSHYKIKLSNNNAVLCR